MRLAVVATVVFARAAVAEPVTFEKPERLSPLFEALAKAEAGNAGRPVRISWFGDSVSASGPVLDRIRDGLQKKFGDGGPGWVFAIPPNPDHRIGALKRSVTGEWTVQGVSTALAPDRLMGLGVGTARSFGGRIRLTPEAPVTSADVYYVAQPRGGKIVVRAGGVERTIATASAVKQARFEAIAIPDGASKIELQAVGSVRLYGVALESPRGIVVDNLGTKNATVKGLGKNRRDHWRKQLARRAPDLAVIMIGTNEVQWYPAKGPAIDEHGRVFRAVLETIRGDAGRACLVVSPLDQIDWRNNDKPRPGVAAIIAVQRAAALEAGCTFWDTRAWMGGDGSSKKWYRDGLLTNTFAHPTARGANRIGDAFVAAIVDGYAAWRAGRPRSKP